MSTLEDLRKSVEDMSDEELLERVRLIREDRKVSKHAVTVSKARGQKKATSLAKKIEGMSDEEKAAFIKMLQEADADGN